MLQNTGTDTKCFMIHVYFAEYCCVVFLFVSSLVVPCHKSCCSLLDWEALNSENRLSNMQQHLGKKNIECPCASWIPFQGLLFKTGRRWSNFPCPSDATRPRGRPLWWCFDESSLLRARCKERSSLGFLLWGNWIQLFDGQDGISMEDVFYFGGEIWWKMPNDLEIWSVDCFWMQIREGIVRLKRFWAVLNSFDSMGMDRLRL